MPARIKKLSLQGFRGVQDVLAIPLDGKSVIIYGDNGTGKSSISDAIEWFFKDNVQHLASSEIDLLVALRNAHIESSKQTHVELAITRPSVNVIKSISSKHEKLTSELDNDSSSFLTYLESSRRENLILRYQFLTNFVSRTKGDKLKSLSDIIGYAEMNKVKEILKKSINAVKSEIKTQNFEGQINSYKSSLIEKIGATVSEEGDLFKALNEIIGQKNLGIEIKSIADIDIVLNKLNSTVDTTLIYDLQFLQSCKTTLAGLKVEQSLLNSEYEKFYSGFKKIAGDVESMANLFLKELLRSGLDVLENNYHQHETCPLCLQAASTEELSTQIRDRLNDIEETTQKATQIELEGWAVSNLASERQKRLIQLISNSVCGEKRFEKIKQSVDSIISKLVAYEKCGRLKVASGKMLDEPMSVNLSDRDFEILFDIETALENIQKQNIKDDKTILYSQILASKEAFLKIKELEKDRAVIESQRSGLLVIYNEFVKKQKEGLEDFISMFSASIDEFYQFMNPNEQFHELRIVTIGDEDELNGITIEYMFDGKWVSPPQKYFSESHLNCFGISFFLASVRAFNQANEFVVFDDVISSFDSNHRARFANLILERFSDQQVILITHEKEWYQYVSQIAKRKGWLIKETKWNNLTGTYMESEPHELRKEIGAKLIAGDFSDTGNAIRRFLENMLKDICRNLEVKVDFRFNEQNERRMPDELLNELKSKINKYSSDLKMQMSVIDRVANSNVLGNLLSHDNKYSATSGDVNAFWSDCLEMEKLFYCQDPACNRSEVAIKNYDIVTKRVRCGCGKTNYQWNK